MKEFIKRKFFEVVIFTALVIMFNSCSIKHNINTSKENIDEKASRTYSVSMLDTNSECLNNVEDIVFCESLNCYIVLKEVYKENRSYVYFFDENLELQEEINLGLKINERIDQRWDYNNSGDMFFIIDRKKEIHDEIDPDIISWEDEEYIKIYNHNKKSYSDFQIPDVLKDIYIEKVFLLDDGRSVILANDFKENRFYVMNEELEIIDEFSLGNIGAVMTTVEKGGVISFVSQNGENYIIGTIDINDKRMVNKRSTCYENQSLCLFYGVSDELYFQLGDRIEILSENESQYICNLGAVGISGLYVSNITSMPDGNFLIGVFDNKANVVFYVLRELIGNEAEMINKTILTVGVGNVDIYTLDKIKSLNLANEFYQIQIKDYSKYNSDDNNAGASDQLFKDYISGNAPDIIVCSSFGNSKVLENAGAFADLSNYLDDEEDLKRSDIVPVVLNAFNNNGKIYSLPESFQWSTNVVSTKYIKSNTSWTVENMIETYSNFSSEIDFMDDISCEEMLSILVYECADDFIDYNAKKCSFDSDTFINLLKFCKSYDQNRNQQTNRDKFMEQVFVSSFEDFHNLVSGKYENEKISFVGYPGKNGGNGIISSNMCLAINNNSINKKGSWEVIKKFFMYDYQKGVIKGFPINVKAFNDAAENALIPYYDENGIIVPNYYETLFGKKDIGYFSEEEKELLINLLNSNNRTILTDDNIYMVIQEELMLLINDDSTPEQTAKKLQNKINLYLNEQK